MKELFYSRGELIDECSNQFKHKDLLVADARHSVNTLARVTLFWYGEVRIFRDALEKYVAFNVDHFEGLHMIDGTSPVSTAGLRIAGVEITDFPCTSIVAVEAKRLECITVTCLTSTITPKIPVTSGYMEETVNMPWKA